MASEIRVDKINSLSGVGTVTLSPTGVDIAGITTAATLRATTGIVTSLTAGSLTSLGAVSGTTGTFSGAISGTTGTFTGNVAVSGANITLQDSGGATDDRIVLGAGSDLSIYHDGSHSIIQETGTGDLELCSNTRIMLQKDRTEALAKFIPDGAVELYHDNTKRFATTDKGADVFGNGTTNNVFKLINTSGTSNASHHMTLDTFNASGYWSDLKIDASNIQLNTYTGNRATLSNTALTFASGVNIVMASGNGIDFSATADGSGSSQAEILDDYEEGTWTFAITPGGGSYQYNYGQTGYYSKIGNQVFINAWVHLVVASTVSGGITLSGLPFPCQNRSRNWIPVGGYGHGGPPIASSGLWMVLTVNSTNASFIYNDDQFGTAVGLTAGNLPTSAEMYINGSYITDS